MTRTGIVKLSLGVIAVGLACVIVETCGIGTLRCHYIFEDGFRGFGEIVEHRPNGIGVRRSGWTYVFDVPRDGNLLLKGDNPSLDHWSEDTASYHSGATLPVVGRVEDLPSEKPAMLHLKVDSNRVSTFFVGTKQDWGDPRYTQH